MSEQLIATPGFFGENENFLLEREIGSGGMGGVYMGVKNRYTVNGLETEILPLPEALYERIVFAEENLKKII